jgi:hypothetical protein
MSAYIMDESGFLALADELASRAESRNNVCDLNYSLSSTIRTFLGFPSSCFEAPDDAHPEAALLAQDLYNANVRAVNERYDETETPAQLSFRRRHYSPQWSPHQLYKNLLCLIYQMSEGDVPESDLYKRLDKLTDEIAVAIVSSSPEYDRASWGWKSEEVAA